MAWHRYKHGWGSYYRGRTKSGRYYTKSYGGGNQVHIRSIWDILILLIMILVMNYIIWGNFDNLKDLYHQIKELYSLSF